MLRNELTLPCYKYCCRSKYYIKGHKTKLGHNTPRFKVIQLEYIASHRTSNKFVNLSANAQSAPFGFHFMECIITALATSTFSLF